MRERGWLRSLFEAQCDARTSVLVGLDTRAHAGGRTVTSPVFFFTGGNHLAEVGSKGVLAPRVDEYGLRGGWWWYTCGVCLVWCFHVASEACSADQTRAPACVAEMNAHFSLH